MNKPLKEFPEEAVLPFIRTVREHPEYFDQSVVDGLLKIWGYRTKATERLPGEEEIGLFKCLLPGTIEVEARWDGHQFLTADSPVLPEYWRYLYPWEPGFRT
jgi:hypothetical protein